MFFIPISKDFLIFLLLSVPFFENPNSSDSKQSLSKLSRVNNDFGLRFFGLLSANNNNDIISPISMLCALSILNNGANGQTYNELKQILGFNKNNMSDEEINEGFNALLTQINSENNNLVKGFILNIENRVVVQNDFRILADFWNSLKEYFKADIQSVDFAKDGQNVVNDINQWIKTKTNNKIEKFFEEPFDPMTKLVIVNAVYFKGEWLNPFSESSTYKSDFFNDGMIKTEVKMMSKMRKRWNYTTSVELDSDLLELPYKGDDLSLVIVLPREPNGLQKLKSVINEEKLNLAIESLKLTKVNVYLPKFKIEQKYELKSALSKNLTLKAFTNEADFSRINGQKDLKVSQVLHKVIIEVNERGSEAAAVTGIEMMLMSMEFNPNIFRADHPFMYLIRDKRNGIILFIGQINRL